MESLCRCIPTESQLEMKEWEKKGGGGHVIITNDITNENCFLLIFVGESIGSF
jgi:hypothetical protein